MVAPGGVEGGDPALVQQEPVGGGRVTGQPGDLATVVDLEGGGPGGAGHVDRREATPLPHIAVVAAGGVEVLAYHLAAVVEAERLAADRAGGVEPGEPAALQQEAPLEDLGGSRTTAVSL